MNKRTHDEIQRTIRDIKKKLDRISASIKQRFEIEEWARLRRAVDRRNRRKRLKK